MGSIHELEADAIHEDSFRLASGLGGVPLTVPSANPRNFHQAISGTGTMSRQDLRAKLFVPESPGPHPAVIIVPGSLGLQLHHMQIAAAVTDASIAALAIDPFSTRRVVTTVHNQVQFSFAASAWDVLAAAGVLASCPDIDSSRIGAQGHSRGGSAVLNAASVHLAAAAGAPKLIGVYAAYPWSGQQFLDPDVGTTRVRAIIGDRDDWCPPVQVQAHIQAIRASGGDATVRIVPGANHSFDRTTPLEHIPEASVTPGRPPSTSPTMAPSSSPPPTPRTPAWSTATASSMPSRPASECAAPTSRATPISCRSSTTT